MSNKINKINVGGVEYTLPSGSTAHVEGSALYINNSGSGSNSGGSSSGGSGSGGSEVSSTIFENIFPVSGTPDDQKIYRKQQFIIYVYYDSLINYNEVLEQDGGSINFIQVKELPTNPLPSIVNGVFTVYILNNDMYAHDSDYGWMSNDAIVKAMLPTFTYGGRIDSLDTSNLVNGTVYLYFGAFEYVNVCDNKKFTFADKDKVSEEITTVKSDVTTVKSSVTTVKSDIADIKSNKQNVLVSGQNIKTLNGKSLLGSGNMAVGVGSPGSAGSSEIFNDMSNKATGNYSHAEGSGTEARGIYSHAEGHNTFAYGDGSHVEGGFFRSSNIDYNTEYIFTTVDGGEGFSCDTLIPVGTVMYFKNNDDSFAGIDKIASVTGTESPYIHYLSMSGAGEEGLIFKGYVVNYGAIGAYSHVEGSRTLAFGSQSHAEGNFTKALGTDSHAEGYSTIAHGSDSHVQGKYNIEDTNNKYAHIVGNGSYYARSNAHTLDWEGNAWFKGNIRVGGTSWDDATPVGGVISGNVFENVSELPQVVFSGNFVPNSGEIANLYFNKNMTSSEFAKIASQLTYIDLSSLGLTSQEYIVLMSENYVLAISKLSDTSYQIRLFNTTEQSVVQVYTEFFGFDISSYELNETAIPSYNGILIGSQNDILSSAISISEFVPSIDITKIYCLSSSNISNFYQYFKGEWILLGANVKNTDGYVLVHYCEVELTETSGSLDLGFIGDRSYITEDVKIKIEYPPKEEGGIYYKHTLKSIGFSGTPTEHDFAHYFYELYQSEIGAYMLIRNYDGISLSHQRIVFDASGTNASEQRFRPGVYKVSIYAK